MMARRWAIRVLFSLVVGGVCTLRSAEVDYGKAVDAARAAGNLAEVNRLCKEWAAKAPGDENPHIILGQVLAEAGMVERAVERFEMGVEANPLSPVPRCELGSLFLKQQELDMAAKELTAALKIDAAYVPAQLGMARVKQLSDDVPGALAAAEGILDRAPDNADARLFAAECLQQLGRG